MAEYKEKYYELPEAAIQELVRKAKLGDDRAQEDLLEVFSNFLSKYKTLLYTGKYNLGDYDVRRFIGLFVKDKMARSMLARNKLNPPMAKKVHEVVSGINYMVRRYCTQLDVQQTVDMTFLMCVTRYEPAESKLKQGEKVPFKGYIYSYYYYLLQKNVKEFLIDQLGRKTFPLIDFETEDDNDEMAKGFKPPPSPSVEEMIGAEEIDELWVAGDTAVSPFSELTPQERLLLKWRYSDGYRSSQIAEKTTEHPNTTRDHIIKIKLKIQKNMEICD